MEIKIKNKHFLYEYFKIKGKATLTWHSFPFPHFAYCVPGLLHNVQNKTMEYELKYKGNMKGHEKFPGLKFRFQFKSAKINLFSFDLISYLF